MDEISLAIIKCRWEDDIKIGFRETGCDTV